MLLKDTVAPHRVPGLAAPAAGFGMRGLEGAADVLMLPDPATFRALPWAPHSGWMLCDIYFPDGRPMPLCHAPHLPQRAARRSADAGYDFVAGLEVEFHLFKLRRADSASATPANPASPASRPTCRCCTRATST